MGETSEIFVMYDQSSTFEQDITGLLDMNFFPRSEFDKLEQFLKTNRANVEIEARLGHFKNDKFVAGIREKDFIKLRNNLLALSVENGGDLEIFASKTIDLRAKSEKDTDEANIIKTVNIEDGSISYTKKTRQGKIDSEFNYRISKATEENLNPDFVTVEFEENGRQKDRISFIDRNENGLFYGVRLDLTVAKLQKGDAIFTSYEVEMERKANLTINEFLARLAHLYFFYQGLADFFLTSYPKMMSAEEAKSVIFYQFNVMSTDERSSVVQQINNIISGSKSTGGVSFKRNEAINIKMKDLLTNTEFKAITAKLDGVRKFMYICDKGVFLINPPFEIIKISNFATESQHLLDGELILYTEIPRYYVFDCLIASGRNVMAHDLFSRLKHIPDILKNSKSLLKGVVKLFAKRFWHEQSFYENVRNTLKDVEKFEDKGLKTDGLIIQPVRLPYKNTNTLKWKPVEQLTIDFRVVELEKHRYQLFTFSQGDKEENKIEETEMGFELKLKKGVTSYAVSEKGKVRLADLLTTEGKMKEEEEIVYEPLEKSKKSQKPRVVDKLFKGSIRYPYDQTVKFKKGLYQGKPVNNSIVEFGWDYEKSNFVPIRYREDKSVPNRTDVAIAVWEDINEPIKRSTIEGKDLAVMNVFHDIVKNHLNIKFISKGSKIAAVSDGVTESDIRTWKNESFYVYDVEQNKNSADNTNTLLKKVGGVKGKVIVDKISNYESIEKKVDKVHAITAFFSLGGVAKDDDTFNGFIKSMQLLLKHQGVVIGFMLDDVRVKELLGDEDTYESESFILEKVDEWTDHVTGNKIKITTKNPEHKVKTEYLLNYNILAKKLADVRIDNYTILGPKPLVTGMKINIITPYANVFLDRKIQELPKSAQDFSRLFRIFVFTKKSREKELITEPLTGPFMKQFLTSIGPHLLRRTTIPGNSNLIHAALSALDSKYEALSTEEKINYVNTFRKKFTKKLTLQAYNELGGGILAKNLAKSYLYQFYNIHKKIKAGIETEIETELRNEALEKANKIGYKKFKSMLENPDDWLGDNCEIIEFLSNAMDVNIFLFDGSNRMPYLPACEGTKIQTKKSICKRLYKKDRASIFIVNIDNVHFETIGKRHKEEKKFTTVFSFTNPMVTKIMGMLCNEKS